jgi:hypothetical protein
LLDKIKPGSIPLLKKEAGEAVPNPHKEFPLPLWKGERMKVRGYSVTQDPSP